ncbi:uncharacterized protein LOC124409253 [Diprion similis]|uniref:uncharacterized protein LOC124409253 n=1 Tax=Diprion similis TaxID=362088 RepID=UPI001EF7B847|nr:uncharacterized protein LOC124409253 [Diprion similis]
MVIQSIGKNLSLECQLPNYGNYPTRWSTVDRDLVTNLTTEDGTELVVQNNRYGLVKNAARSTTTFTIKNFQREDTGLYRCEVGQLNSPGLLYDVNVGVRE